MRHFRRCFALFFLTLWFGVTLHCNLEAAEVLTAAEDCCADQESCLTDHCKEVENGNYRIATGTIKAQPNLIALVYFGCSIAMVPVFADESRLIATDTFQRPLDWVPTWRFARRAAPLARAPSLA